MFSSLKSRKTKTDRLFVLGLDGVPFSFVEKAIASGELPNLGALAASAGIRKIRSELPPVSSVAWTSFATGVGPGGHGIFGFVDRVAATGELFIPTARNRRADPIWKRLGDAGRRAVAVNVPLSYPPDDIRGCVVSGFLCPSLDRATNRPDVARWLKEIGYVIDVDASLGRKDDKGPFLAALDEALAARRRLALRLLETEPWDYFQLHIMETDRINHFLWDAGRDPSHPWAEAFRRFYRQVDSLVGELIERVADRARWIVLSDHGFCRARREVNVNALLRDLGFLDYKPAGEAMSLDPVEPASRAFSLLPGRIYINLAGRERRGTVDRSDYESVKSEVASALAETVDPETGEHIFAAVLDPREVYEGPCLAEGPDLIALARDGFDLKAGFRPSPSPFRPPSIAGIHTYDDAFVIGGERFLGDAATIGDVGRRVGEMLL